MEEKVLLDVQINAQDALKNYQVLQQRIADLRREQDALRKSGKENSDQFIANDQAIKALSKRAQEYQKEVQNNIKVEHEQTGSMQAMKAQLSLATAEFNKLSAEERKLDLERGRKGMESYSKTIKDLDVQLKEAEGELGNFRRSVGNYEGAIQNVLGVNSQWFKALQGLAGLFGGANTNINQGRQVIAGFGQATQDAGTKMQGASSAMASLNQNANEGRTIIQGFATATTSTATATSGLTQGLGVVTNATKAFGKQLLALLANPIVAIIAGIAAVFMALSSAIKSDEEATNALQRVFAPLQGIFDLVTSALQKLVGFILKGVEGFTELAMSASKLMESLPLVGGMFAEVNKNIENQVEAVKAHQQAVEMEREQIVRSAETQNQVAKLRDKIAQKDKYSTEERRKMLQQAIELERKEADEQKRLAQVRLKALQLESANTKNTAEMKRKLAEATAAVTQADTNYLQVTRRMQQQLASFNEEIKRDAESQRQDAQNRAKEAQQRAKERADKEREAIRQEEDTTTNLILNEYEKRRATINMQYSRQIEDLKRRLAEEQNLTERARQSINKTIANLQAQQTRELQKIADEETKNLQKVLSDLDAMIGSAEGKKAQGIIDTYAKAQATAQKEIENLQAKLNEGRASKEEEEALYQLYQYQVELEKRKNEELENLNRESAQKRIKQLEEVIANEGAKGLADYTKTEVEKTNLMIAESQKRIALYKDELSKTTDPKLKLDLERKIAQEEQKMRENQQKSIQLQMQNELADTTLTADEKYRIKQEYLQKELEAVKGNADAEREVNQQMIEARKEYLNELADSFDDFASKADQLVSGVFQIMANNEKKELDSFKKSQEQKKVALKKRLDNGLMTEEDYNAQVQALDEETDKKQLEIEIAQAKRQKAQGIINALINTASAIMRIWADVPKFDFGASTIALTAMASALGAVQVATIASQPLPTAGDGMFIEGPSHAQGGVLINAEGGEAIINKRATKKYLPLLSRINQSTGGVPLYGAGGIAGIQNMQSAIGAGVDYEALAEACANIPVYTAVTDINRGQGRVARIVARKSY